MDTAQIAGWVKANKVEVLGVGAAAVAGLALLQRKKGGTAAAGGVTAGAVAPGTIPAGAVVGTGSAGTYDSTSYDLYNALQDEIGSLARQNEAAGQTGAGGSGASAAVTAPIASGLFAPTGTGQWVRYAGDGVTAEVESDGSLFGLAGPQITALRKAGLNPTIVTIPGKRPAGLFSTANNIKPPPGTPTPVKAF